MNQVNPKQPDDAKDLITFTFHLDGPDTGKTLQIGFRTVGLWMLYKILNQIGVEGVESLITTAGALTEVIAKEEVTDLPDTFGRVWQSLATNLNVAPREPASLVVGDEQEVLGFCYALLRNQIIGREQAADIAKILLQSKEPIDVDAWRKRVNRWADREKLPHPGKPRQRKR